jgi:hypothetical protein
MRRWLKVPPATTVALIRDQVGAKLLITMPKFLNIAEIANSFPRVEVGSVVPLPPELPAHITPAIIYREWHRECVNMFDVTDPETLLVAWVAMETASRLAADRTDPMALPPRLADDFSIPYSDQQYRLRYFTSYNTLFGRFWLDASDPISLVGDLPSSLPGPPALGSREIATAWVNIRSMMSPLWNPVYLTWYPVYGEVEVREGVYVNWVATNIGQEIVLGRSCNGYWRALFAPPLLSRRVREPIIRLARERRLVDEIEV